MGCVATLPAKDIISSWIMGVGSKTKLKIKEKMGISSKKYELKIIF